MAQKPVILCVDDEPLALEVRSRVLEQAGYDVLSTVEPQRALYLLASNHVDMVLMDHLLPGMPGTELAGQMKKVRPDLPIVLLSGVVEEPESMSHIDVFISKTEPPETVLSKIAHVLAHSHPTKPGTRKPK